jgi:hypothetical protein
MKFAALLFILFSLPLFLGMGARAPQVPLPQLPPVSPEDVEIITKISIVSLKGFTSEQAAHFTKVVVTTERVVNSKEFKSMVEGWYHKSQNKFHDTADSPQVVYKKITSNDWKLEYKLEYMRSSTIGYTYPTVKWIALNKAKFNKLSNADLSQNICHEYGGHKLGRYGHSMKHNADRPFSVPYGIGYICKTLYNRFER